MTSLLTLLRLHCGMLWPGKIPPLAYALRLIALVAAAVFIALYILYLQDARATEQLRAVDAEADRGKLLVFINGQPLVEELDGGKAIFHHASIEQFKVGPQIVGLAE